MYQTAKDRQAQDRSLALLWLFIHSKGMAQDFTEFCRERKELSLAEVERELREITKQK